MYTELFYAEKSYPITLNVSLNFGTSLFVNKPVILNSAVSGVFTKINNNKWTKS